MAMKLQWLPEPDARGGWSMGTGCYDEAKVYHGFDRYGGIRASVKYEQYHGWEVSNAPHVKDEPEDECNARMVRQNREDAMKLAESYIEDDGEGV